MSEMQVSNDRYMRIRFVNGTERSFGFHETDDLANVASRLERVLASNYLRLQMEDKFIVIPLVNVESVEIVPGLEKTIPDVLHVTHEFS